MDESSSSSEAAEEGAASTSMPATSLANDNVHLPEPAPRLQQKTSKRGKRQRYRVKLTRSSVQEPWGIFFCKPTPGRSHRSVLGLQAGSPAARWQRRCLQNQDFGRLICQRDRLHAVNSARGAEALSRELAGATAVTLVLGRYQGQGSRLPMEPQEHRFQDTEKCARTEMQDVTSFWYCPVCDEPNRANRERCNNCGLESHPTVCTHANIGADAGESADHGCETRWTCPTCDEPNRADRKTCNNCGADRESPMTSHL